MGKPDASPKTTVYAARSPGGGGGCSSAIISAHSATHSLQIATAGVGPATIDSTSLRGLPQNEQRIDSADRLGPWTSSLMALG